MNLPSQLQQQVEAWASRQGISNEQFVIQAIAEKIDALSQKTSGEHNFPTLNTVRLAPIEMLSST